MNVIDVAHRLVHDPKHGGSPALALRLGMTPTVLNSKVNPQCNTHHLRLDEALTLMEFTGNHSIMHAMASRLGGAYCKVDYVDGIDEMDILMTALSTSACQGDLMAQMYAALEDGHISPSQAEGILIAAQNVMSTLQKLSLQIREKNGDR